jgi:hypothetical protein
MIRPGAVNEKWAGENGDIMGGYLSLNAEAKVNLHGLLLWKNSIVPFRVCQS